MTPALKAIVEAMDKELGRQAREEVHMAWVGELDGSKIVIDGTIDLEKVARAGLAAIRQPPLEAVWAGASAREQQRGGYDYTEASVWRAMIDEILKETP